MPASLHIDTGREMRGGQWQVLYLVRGLTAEGHQAVLLARAGAPLLERAIQEGIDARPFGLREVMKLAPSFDLVHAHDARAHTLASFVSVPLVVARRVAFPLRDSIVSRWKYSRAARYIAVSNYVKQVLLDAGIPIHKISVVYDGVPLPPPPSYQDAATVLALDSTDPAKGHALIAEAARRAQIPVVFSKDLPADLNLGAAFYLYITELEGLGPAALIAMASGVAVLASSVGGLPEIVKDGETGLLTSNDPEQISHKMLVMMQDPELRDRLRRAARARVEQAFTTEHMTRKTLEVYKKVLD